MKKEKRIQILISKTLFYGVLVSSVIMITGLAVVYLFGGSYGGRIIMAGVLALIITPIARVVLLAAGYAHAGRPRFAVMSLIIIATMAFGYIIGK
ncbi:MAG: DUF1634 domain-containing protein [Elusimicrobiaceae bacterium]|jgi:uncharacterized membrane protein